MYSVDYLIRLISLMHACRYTYLLILHVCIHVCMDVWTDVMFHNYNQGLPARINNLLSFLQ